MKMSDADRTQILNACQFLRDRGYSLVDSDEYSIDLSDGEHIFTIEYDRYYDGAFCHIEFIIEQESFSVGFIKSSTIGGDYSECSNNLSKVLYILDYAKKHYDDVSNIELCRSIYKRLREATWNIDGSKK